MSYLKHCNIVDRIGDLPTDILPKVKDYLQVDFNDQDALILNLIKQAISYIERYASRIIWRADCISYYTNQNERISLFYNDNIVLTGDSADKYEVKGDEIITKDEDVELTHQSGYTIANLPDWALSAICTNVAFRYEKRGDDFPNNLVDIHTKEFLRPFVKWSML